MSQWASCCVPELHTCSYDWNVFRSLNVSGFMLFPTPEIISCTIKTQEICLKMIGNQKKISRKCCIWTDSSIFEVLVFMWSTQNFGWSTSEIWSKCYNLSFATSLWLAESSKGDRVQILCLYRYKSIVSL